MQGQKWACCRVFSEGYGQPIGVFEYRLTSRLPDGLSGQLPSPQELAGVLEEVEGGIGDEKGLRRDGGGM